MDLSMIRRIISYVGTHGSQGSRSHGSRNVVLSAIQSLHLVRMFKSHAFLLRMPRGAGFSFRPIQGSRIRTAAANAASPIMTVWVMWLFIVGSLSGDGSVCWVIVFHESIVRSVPVTFNRPKVLFL